MNLNNKRNWDEHIKYVLEQEAIDSKIKDEYIKATQFLEHEFGQNILARDKHEKNNRDERNPKFHPLTNKVFNKAGWQILELIEFANNLKLLKSINCNYNKLKGKILSFDKSIIEGFPFVAVGSSLLRSSFNVKYLDENKTRRTPDIEITNQVNDDLLFVEITSLGESDERNKICGNYNYIRYCFESGVFLPFTGRQKKLIEQEDWKVIFEVIAKAKQDACLYNEIITVSNHPKLEFSVAPLLKFDELKKLSEEIGTNMNNVDGLIVPFDETKRILAKIQDKAQQIPQNKNGLIYIMIHPLAFITMNTPELMTTVIDYIRSFSNILGVVLQTRFTHERQEDVFQEVENHCLSIRVIGDSLYNLSLLIFNHDCNMEIHDSTLRNIQSSIKF